MGVHAPYRLPPHRRASIEGEIEFCLQRATLLIARLDRADGDADLEANGDELDGTNAEDEESGFSNMGLWSGPGCPISDPDKGVDDDGEQVNEDGDEDGTLLPIYGIDQSKWIDGFCHR